MFGSGATMEYMPNSLLKPLHSMMGKNWTAAWCRNQICSLILCNAQSTRHQKHALKAIINNPSLENLSRNDCVAASIKEIDEVFWKAIYCLLCAVFPALKALKYCNSKILAMDKIFFQVKRVDEALLYSQIFLEDEDLFGSMRDVILSE